MTNKQIEKVRVTQIIVIVFVLVASLEESCPNRNKLVPQYILSKGTGDTLLQTGHKGVAMNRFNLFVAMINANKHM